MLVLASRAARIGHEASWVFPLPSRFFCQIFAYRWYAFASVRNFLTTTTCISSIVNWCFGFLTFPSKKRVLLQGVTCRIPNHQFTISWLYTLDISRKAQEWHRIPCSFWTEERRKSPNPHPMSSTCCFVEAEKMCMTPGHHTDLHLVNVNLTCLNLTNQFPCFLRLVSSSPKNSLADLPNFVF